MRYDGIIAGGVAGTPWFFLNGVDVGLHPSLRLDAQQWTDIITNLLE
jgi:hypothetical protein